MKRYLLIILCFFLLTSCSSTVKTNNTLEAWVFNESNFETLPVTADLTVSEQKARGEASGKFTDRDELIKKAVAKALGQEVPSADKPDEFIGNIFTERDGTDLKVIVTGYPAYYTNFRTATKDDSLRLNMFNSGAPPIIYNTDDKPKTEGEQHKSSGEWYFSIKHQFGDDFGWGIGAGIRNPTKLWNGGIFYGLGIEEMGILSPWKNTKNVDWFGLAGNLNLGGDVGLPYGFKLVGGLSGGFWYSEYDYDNGHYDDSDSRGDILFGPFVKLRWHGLEAGLRFLFGSNADYSKFSLGFTI